MSQVCNCFFLKAVDHDHTFQASPPTACAWVLIGMHADISDRRVCVFIVYMNDNNCADLVSYIAKVNLFHSINKMTGDGSRSTAN